MKRSIISILVIATLALLALGFVMPAQAQTVLNPNGMKLYYTDPLVAARAYADNTTDTLPNLARNQWYKASKQTSICGGASAITLKIVSLDSMYAVVYVDEKIGSTWTAVVTDSVIAPAATTQEVIIRSTTAEGTKKLSGAFRARLVFPSYRTQGVSSATYTADILWKP